MSEEKNTIIDIVVDSFSKMVKAFKEHGFLLATYVFMLFLILYSFVLNPININTIIEKKFEKEKADREFVDDKAFEKRLKADKLMMPILDKIVERNEDIERALIFEMHNGTISKGKLDLLYLSATFESISTDKPKLEYIADNFQKQSLNSMFVGGVSMFAYKRYLYFSDLAQNGNDSRLLKKLNKFGVNSVMILPIIDSNHIPVILLCLTSSTSFDAESEYNRIEPYLHQVSEILMQP